MLGLHDHDYIKRKTHDFWNIAWGFFLGCLACVLLSFFVRNC